MPDQNYPVYPFIVLIFVLWQNLINTVMVKSYWINLGCDIFSVRAWNLILYFFFFSFQMSVEMFDYMDEILNLQSASKYVRQLVFHFTGEFSLNHNFPSKWHIFPHWYSYHWHVFQTSWFVFKGSMFRLALRIYSMWVAHDSLLCWNEQI